MSTHSDSPLLPRNQMVLGVGLVFIVIMAAAFFLPDSLEVSSGCTSKVGILLLSGEAIKSVAPITVAPSVAL